MSQEYPGAAHVTFALGVLVSALATVSFATGATPAAGLTLLAIALVLLVLGGYQVGRSRRRPY